MNALNIILQNFSFNILLVFFLGINQIATAQFDQKGESSFLNIIEKDSKALALLHESRVKNLYYVQNEISKEVRPLMKMHCKTSGWRYERLDNQYKLITEKAISLGLNSIRVDSSVINGTVCEYWISLYYLGKQQINRNESIVGDNLLCVFGKFDDKYKKGKSFKINGRKIELMPYEFVQRNIAIDKRGSVDINRSRIELVGGKEGGELFLDGSASNSSNISVAINVGRSFGKYSMIISQPLSGKNNVRGIPRNFAYFLYNIYKEKVVIAKTREAMIAAKRKEWREKKAKEEAKKKAKEEKKKKG